MYSQPLPFSAERQEKQFLNLTLNNPPYVPQYDGMRELLPLVPFAAAFCAMEIQANCGRNPLRTFMFNQYSENSFANKQFEDLVKLSLDYAALALINRVHSNPEEAIRDASLRIIEMLCAINVSIPAFRDLERYIDPNVAPQISASITEFHNVVDRITRAKQPQTSYGQNYQIPQSQYGGNSNMGGNFGSNRTSGPTVNPGSGALFSGNGRASTPSAPANDFTMGSSKYVGNRNNPVAQPFVPKGYADMITEKPAVVVPSIRKIKASETDIKWTPTADAPYYPSFNPYNQEIIFNVDNFNKILSVNVVDKEGKDMDYNRHRTSTVFGKPPTGMGFGNPIAANVPLLKGAKSLNIAAQTIGINPEPENDPNISIFIKPAMMVETSLHAAWLNGDLSRLEKTKDGEPPFAYRAFAHIAKPNISNRDESHIVDDCRFAETFLTLKDILNNYSSKMSPGLWGIINKKMTEIINRMLKQNMSIPNLSIDSFTADIEELIDYLGTEFGSVIKDAFLKEQKQFIYSAFKPTESGLLDDLTVFLLEGRVFDGVEEPVLTYISCNYCLTYLDCLSFELDIELSKDVSSMVTKVNTPLLHGLIENMFENEDVRITTHDRYLIKTNDHRILECSRGLIGEGIYLVTLVE